MAPVSSNVRGARGLGPGSRLGSMSASSTASATMSAWVSRTSRTPERAASMVLARSARAGAWSSSRSDSSMENAARTRVSTWYSESELPPRSKKLSWTPTCSTRSNSRQMMASVSSSGVRGATYAFVTPARAPSGAGSALRSTLPFGVSGSASRRTKTQGTMYSGSRAFR